MHKTISSLFICFLIIVLSRDIFAQELESSCWGLTPARNNVLPDADAPDAWKIGKFHPRTGEWDAEKAKNVKWTALLGTESYASPILADGKIFVATNNGRNHATDVPAGTDMGVLLCFEEETGRLLWQFSRPKLDRTDMDWPEQGICSNPAVEGDRLWVVTNRAEVACLDTATGEVVWAYDMIAELGVTPHNATCCSPVVCGELVFAGTSHGVDEKTHAEVDPSVPSFLALNKRTGELVWQDNSPGANILHGQWSSPAVGFFEDAKTLLQVIFPGPDGWLYAFGVEAIREGRAALVWKFDCNPKDSVWKKDGSGTRNSLVASPCVADGRVFIATGDDPEFGEGEGILWCVDPTKEGDVTDTAAVWRYVGKNVEKPSFEEKLHRSLSTAAVADGIVIVGDHAGVIHAVDAQTGEFLWSYDMMSQVWGSALIAGKRIYIGDQDGDMAIFALSRELNVIAEIENKNSIFGGAAFKDGVLYIVTRSHLIAVGEE